ncbi:MAG: hypothetical protein SFU56_08180 [Capsulimonadales bacterium]|nr:hypothetical protein [Capsulimonadales bacterium]
MLKDIREILTEDLTDPTFQQAFLMAMYEEGGTEGVLEGLREIALATGRMGEIARNAGIARTTVYRSLSKNGNPAFRTVRAALNTLGLDLAVVPKTP